MPQILLCTIPDPTLTIENIIGVMENVAADRRKDMWSRWGIIPHSQLEEIYQKYSDEEQRIHACADFYVNCHPESSWTYLCQMLYMERKTKKFKQLQTGE